MNYQDKAISKALTQIGVGAVILSEGRLLMLRRTGLKPAEWTIPGGEVVDKEAPYETLIREVLEETTLKITKAVELGQFQLLIKDKVWTSNVFVVLAFEGLPSVGEGEPFDAVEWFPLSQLPPIDYIASKTLTHLDSTQKWKLIT